MLWVAFALPVLAVDPPDEIAIGKAYAYTNLLEVGDLLVVGSYTISYTTNPTDGVDVNFLTNLELADVIIGTNTPYPYFDSDADGDLDGYGQGVVSVYLTAAQTLAQGLTDSNGAWVSWPATDLELVVRGNPSAFTTIPEASHPLVSTNFSSSEVRSINQTVLGAQVIEWALNLQIAWDTALLVQGANLLNDTDGAAYFVLTIPGLRQMASHIFATQTTSPTIPTLATTTGDFATAAESRLDAATYYGQGFNDLADDLGLPRGSVEGFLILLLVIALIAWMTTQWGTRGAQMALVFSAMAMLPVMMMGTGWVVWQGGAIAIMGIALAAILKTQERLG